MSADDQTTALQAPSWLERKGLPPIHIHQSLSIGRASNNALVLPVEGVSRNHAIIHAQNEGEFWLVDLGSRNGTWLNEHRILQPVRLNDGDRIIIARTVFIFHINVVAPQIPEALQTIMINQSKTMSFWLLITDIENFSTLAREVPSDELAIVVGQWIHSCQTVVQYNGGRINKYLGDGFFATWPDIEGSETQVNGAVQALRALREQEPSFRLVVHRGKVSVGGSPLLGEESFIGSEVNFTFRMEKLAGSLGVPVLFSETANSRLAPLLPMRKLPPQEIKGFPDNYNFYLPE